MSSVKSINHSPPLDIPSILVLFAIPGNFPGMAENFREFPIPGNETFVPESLSLSKSYKFEKSEQTTFEFYDVLQILSKG